MDNKLFTINIILAITDTLIAALAIIVFAWGSQYFERWWMLLFNLVPLAMFNAHALILDVPSEEIADEN